MKRVFHREISVVTDDFHAERRSCIGYRYADASQSDHSQRLADDLTALKLALALFNLLGDVACESGGPDTSRR